MKVTTTNITQPANEILGTNEKTLYYLVIKNNKEEKLTINVGKKTHDNVLALLKNEEGTTVASIEKQKEGGKK